MTIECLIHANIAIQRRDHGVSKGCMFMNDAMFKEKNGRVIVTCKKDAYVPCTIDVGVISVK
jgi:hypothetical protein